jgi:alkanesulfonate monooxygenase SsuD/methylene tetrahydromethanopterin reductase-like flavin-dependent oxidoreductase (luciferase family)
MDIGVFDHLDADGQGLAEFYETRLKLVEHYDRAGLWGYHLAEHHATPLGLAPSPSLFLAAAIQRTRRIRLGPLVYILPLYHPLRLIEEICMLDQMSRGRLLLGVGRGISPYEVGFFGVDPGESQAIYIENLEFILRGLAGGPLDFAGRFHSVAEVPLVLEPWQKPHPPLWYGVINPEAAPFLAQRRINIVSHVAAPTMRLITERYRSEWLASEHRELPLPRMALGRHIVIAEDRGEAIAAARRAYERWYDSFTRLWRRHSARPVSASYPDNFDALMESGVGIAGAPAEVRDIVQAQIAESGCNYWICRFAFGDLTYREALRSLALFVQHVKPALGGEMIDRKGPGAEGSLRLRRKASA